MNNRITYTMYQTFQKLGFSVMRFNFRGVGRSQGRYDGGIGEIGDAAAALDWMQMVNPSHGGLWIAGYSFGAFVGMQLLMRRPEVTGWIFRRPHPQATTTSASWPLVLAAACWSTAMPTNLSRSPPCASSSTS